MIAVYRTKHNRILKSSASLGRRAVVITHSRSSREPMQHRRQWIQPRSTVHGRPSLPPPPRDRDSLIRRGHGRALPRYDRYLPPYRGRNDVDSTSAGERHFIHLYTPMPPHPSWPSLLPSRLPSTISGYSRHFYTTLLQRHYDLTKRSFIMRSPWSLKSVSLQFCG